MKNSFLGGVALLAVWLALVFLGWRSGLAHIPLAIATVLIARGIVLGGPQPPAAP